MKRPLLVLLFGILLVARAGAEETALPEWRASVESLVPMGELAAQLSDPNDPQLREEFYRFMYSTVALGYFALSYADTEHPDFYPHFNEAFNFYAPNPDNSYYFTPLADDGVYKISGFRGSVRIVDFQISGGDFLPYGTGRAGRTLANYDLDKIHINKDGSFEVVLSRERPADWKGDWWQLDAGATNMITRQIAFDWSHEIDGRFAIERLDRPAIKPRASVEKIAAGLARIPDFAANWTRFAFAYVKKMRDASVINKVELHDLSSSGGLSTQTYIEGLFDIQSDEALILETELPKQCRYWNFQLTDELWSSIDWMNHQTSLNIFATRRDRDGKVRIVISAQDPGIPNWLDTVGYLRGVIEGRWHTCDTRPLPLVTKVKFADVRKLLPVDTPVVTAAQRDAAIRIRRKAAQLRRRW